MDRSEIKKKLDSIKDLHTLPAIAMELNSLLQADESTVDIIAETIGKDQSIAAKVLKLINSAFFGVRSKVTSIHDAVVLLGFNSIRNIVLSVSVMKAFSKNDAADGFNIADFWKHSIAVAMTAKTMSEKSGISSPEDAFTGGLLHDIGKIIMAQHFREIFIETVNVCEKESLPFSKAEKRNLGGYGHAKMGAFITEKWKFPQTLTDAVGSHHSENDYLSDLTTVVHCADIIVNIQSANKTSLDIEKKKSKMPVFNQQAISKLNVLFATCGEWYPELEEAIEDACAFFIEDAG